MPDAATSSLLPEVRLFEPEVDDRFALLMDTEHEELQSLGRAHVLGFMDDVIRDIEDVTGLGWHPSLALDVPGCRAFEYVGDFVPGMSVFATCGARGKVGRLHHRFFAL